MGNLPESWPVWSQLRRWMMASKLTLIWRALRGVEIVKPFKMRRGRSVKTVALTTTSCVTRRLALWLAPNLTKSLKTCLRSNLVSSILAISTLGTTRTAGRTAGLLHKHPAITPAVLWLESLSKARLPSKLKSANSERVALPRFSSIAN